MVILCPCIQRVIHFWIILLRSTKYSCQIFCQKSCKKSNLVSTFVVEIFLVLGFSLKRQNSLITFEPFCIIFFFKKNQTCVKVQFTQHENKQTIQENLRFIKRDYLPFSNGGTIRNKVLQTLYRNHKKFPQNFTPRSNLIPYRVVLLQGFLLPAFATTQDFMSAWVLTKNCWVLKIWGRGLEQISLEYLASF